MDITTSHRPFLLLNFLASLGSRFDEIVPPTPQFPSPLHGKQVTECLKKSAHIASQLPLPPHPSPPPPPSYLPITAGIWEVVSSALEEVVSEEESSQRVLHSTTHLDHVLQNVSARSLVRLDVHYPHGNQEVAGVCIGGEGV